MSILLSLRTEPEGHITPCLEGQPLAAPTPFDQFPTLERLQTDPFELGKLLTTALGGEALLRRLEADPDLLLLLEAEGRANDIACEFAALPDHRLLAVRFGLLRLAGGRDAPPPVVAKQLRFIALAADPLVDRQGQPREGYRLQIDYELRAIRDTLEGSNVSHPAHAPGAGARCRAQPGDLAPHLLLQGKSYALAIAVASFGLGIVLWAVCSSSHC